MNSNHTQQLHVAGQKKAERLDLTPEWVRRIWLTGNALKKATQMLPKGVLSPAPITRQNMWEIKHHMFMHEKLRARPVPELGPGRIMEKYV